MSGIDEMLAGARSAIRRWSPDALEAALGSVTVVDLRCAEDRRRSGAIPTSISVPRSVLEWRVDPGSESADPRVARFDRPMVLVCAQGYSSSLAAESVRKLGHPDVGDLDGGMERWVDEGHPTEAS